MRIKTRAAMCAASLCVMFGMASAPLQADPYAGAKEHAERIMAGLQEHGAIPGLSACVMIDGQMVWSEGFGWANLEQRAPVTTKTRFRTGSIAKPITAVVLARLLEQGLIDLDAPIGSYLEELPEPLHAITCRQLGGHLGGVRHYAAGDPRDSWYGTHFDTSRSAIDRYAQNGPLIDAPGNEFHYTTYGFALLSAAMEGATDKRFAQLIAEHLTEPLGLHSTGLENLRVITPGRTSYYSRDENGDPINADPLDISYKSGGGGMLTTSEDLCRMASALLSDGFLRPQTRDLLFTSMKNAAGEETGYGLGWSIEESFDGRTIYSHGGAQLGCRTRLSVFPDSKTVVAIMGNQNGGPVSAHAADALERVFAHRDYEMKYNRLRSLEGRYEATVEIDGADVKGWLAIIADGTAIRGELRMYNDTLSQPGLKPALVSIMPEEDEIVMYFVDRRLGVFILPVTREKGKLTGYILRRTAQLPFEATKVR